VKNEVQLKSLDEG